MPDKNNNFQPGIEELHEEPAELLKEVRDIGTLLVKTLKIFCIYPSDNPIPKEFKHNLFKRLSDYLEENVGKKTKILGVSAMDPMGLGPSTTTWSTIFSGIPHTRAEFLRLMLRRVKQLKEKYGF